MTPSHLIGGKIIISLPTGSVITNNLAESYHHVKKVIEDARERWFIEYLTELRTYHSKRKTNIHPKVGSLVLIKDEKRKRQEWKVGKIVEMMIGRNDITRGAVVSLGSDKQKIRRPLELLYPLEAHGWDSFHFSGDEQNVKDSENCDNQESVSIGKDI